jgi:hypothetical protein
MFQARMDRERHALRRRRSLVAKRAISLAGISCRPLGIDRAGRGEGCAVLSCSVLCCAVVWCSFISFQGLRVQIATSLSPLSFVCEHRILHSSSLTHHSLPLPTDTLCNIISPPLPSSPSLTEYWRFPTSDHLFIRYCPASTLLSISTLDSPLYRPSLP